MKDSQRIGGKGTGLVWLSQNTDLGFSVPEFDVIYTSFYEETLKQEQIAKLAAMLRKKATGEYSIGIYNPPKKLEEKCSELADKFKDRGVAVRSSGVISEDSDRFSGAGIYDTFFIDSGQLSTKSLLDNVLKVYASVNNERAVRYRKENGLPNEKMAVVVQECIEPDWSGVMYTSNPTFPKDLTIEFVTGRNRVVDGAEDSMIVEYNKTNMKRVFESEDLPSQLFNINDLARKGINLEKRLEPSDIEFAIKGDNTYFIQRREITDLQNPQRVKVPKYNPEQLLGITKVKRGTGRITLPVVKLRDISDEIDGLALLNMIDPKKAADELMNYFRNVIKKDSQYSSGYILLLPQFQKTVMYAYQLFTEQIGIHGEPTYDNLTPHKKALITTKFGGISSHAMTVAREKGILYADFSYTQNSLDKAETGDVLSIYFLGREAKVFMEESPLRSIHETNPQVSFDIAQQDDGYISVKTSIFLDNTKPYTNDFLLYLKTVTGQEWKYEPFDGVMGGAFSNPDGRHILMHMSQMRGQYHQWSIDPPEMCKVRGYKPLSKKHLLPLIESYAEYLKSK